MFTFLSYRLTQASQGRLVCEHGSWMWLLGMSAEHERDMSVESRCRPDGGGVFSKRFQVCRVAD